ncbi:triphosphoribosyl-dephospho-CoA synthase CitG [Yersinia mollaretii]|uniref:triphosphoribosyl-dephospho-CoA synthase CitG n=1 Tax=Yersinia mollaretii TaxID=33060 RepID=UPI0005DCA7DA|nr:triphosphoribosyl-dephospho-CoA synthase CitG [Yersinia mollaretii]MDA5526539.1 triphosphoribosyl-dephospho-CoA synthase CitG [Yersinia mollaretii]MDR7874867.1 triphosphoribosyl-dephospho-CoA synthase CitG [Yersinia mollaretii]WQC76785.1 triphosphoribosyl-dephospho-CoA synthase CitG [Yersinia mollaretii]CNE54293.1 2-(5''-triphosphoribosyl)-3'-dephosphocoenzyme-A synthase [Yersinia mollaretii]CQJ10178.1 2-(5''-triphosphoribosyl)-3'-dephosphocoenzyme-A synthase [Yersinia mollaretii]
MPPLQRTDDRADPSLAGLAGTASGFSGYWGALAYRAMLTEVNLTPKPGLVDRFNCGAHKDMALIDFYYSADAIAPWLPRFIEHGISYPHLHGQVALSRLRPLGLACENSMFRATGGVNTHKGTVFSLGLICCALGRLKARAELVNAEEINAEAVCQEVASLCCGLTQRELCQANPQQTAGQRLFYQHGLTGARGEAESGFATVLTHALPAYQRLLAEGSQPDHALLHTLLILMSVNRDTNVVSRGGMAGLQWLQQQATEILTSLLSAGMGNPLSQKRVREFDAQCIARNLSPGGSADLLILTWLLAQFPPSSLSQK